MTPSTVSSSSIEWPRRRTASMSARSASTVAIEFAVSRGSSVIVDRRRSSSRSSRAASAALPVAVTAVVAAEVRHLEAVEDRQLDRLVRGRRQLPAGVVELLDEVDRGKIGATELGDLAPEPVARARPADQPGVGQCVEDVGDRRLGQAELTRELARTGGVGRMLGQHLEDRGGSRDRRRERATAIQVVGRTGAVIGAFEAPEIAGRGSGRHVLVAPPMPGGRGPPRLGVRS
jgi:hypothetical protein